MLTFSSDFRDQVDPTSQGRSPEEIVIGNENRRAVQEATKGLPPCLREALFARIGIHPAGHTVSTLAQRRKKSRQWIYHLADQAIAQVRRQLSIN